MRSMIKGKCLGLFLFYLLFCISSIYSQDQLELNDGRLLKGHLIIKNKTYTIVTKKNKIFQFDKTSIKELNGKSLGDLIKAKNDFVNIFKLTNSKNPIIKIVTSLGDMEFELFENKVPNTVANMISLAEKGFYEGMFFHRIIKGFMAQGGCPYSKKDSNGTPGTGGPGYKFEDEFNSSLKHTEPGILSMANSGPNTNGSQFFICFNATPWLNGKHTVFGKIINGIEVLKRLEAIGSNSGTPSRDIKFDIKVLKKQNHTYSVKKI